jgi:hypothetical protein
MHDTTPSITEEAHHNVSTIDGDGKRCCIWLLFILHLCCLFVVDYVLKLPLHCSIIGNFLECLHNKTCWSIGWLLPSRYIMAMIPKLGTSCNC